jgi:hypothetical protein
MKIVSRDIIHKTDAGGVKLGVTDGAAAQAAFAEIVANSRRAVADPDIAGILVTPMAAKGGVEVICAQIRNVMPPSDFPRLPKYSHKLFTFERGEWNFRTTDLRYADK